MRESYKRVQVGRWCGRIGRLILLCMRENMALPFWIKQAVDPESPMAQAEAQEVEYLWRQITAEELGDIDLDISVDLAAMSPAEQASERDSWLAFLNIMQSPSLGMVLMQSPSLLRKTAAMFGITSQRDISEIAKAMQGAALMNAMMQQQQVAAKGQGGGAEPGPTPTNAEIGGQLEAQLPVEVSQA